MKMDRSRAQIILFRRGKKLHVQKSFLHLSILVARRRNGPGALYGVTYSVAPLWEAASRGPANVRLRLLAVSRAQVEIFRRGKKLRVQKCFLHLSVKVKLFTCVKEVVYFSDMRLGIGKNTSGPSTHRTAPKVRGDVYGELRGTLQSFGAHKSTRQGRCGLFPEKVLKLMFVTFTIGLEINVTPFTTTCFTIAFDF